MGVQRFTASNSREAMRQVRAALGEEVLILSNRAVEGGVEIIAMPEQAHEQALSSVASAPVEAPVTAAIADPAVETLQALNRQLLDDVRAMLRENSASGTSAERPSTASLRQRLIRAGFSAELAADVLQDPPEELRDEAADSPATNAWLLRRLEARLSLLESEDALFDAGGVFALVGPTGVGKTTTTAKLASRYVMRHGPKDVALVTTDSYRIGAAEQLRIYARLLGTEVHALEENGDLGDLVSRLTQPRRALLSRSAGKKLTVIDTVGMSQRDQRLVGEISRLAAGPAPVKRILVLNAASHGDTLSQVIEAWQRASTEAGEPLWGCILTKLDEAARLGNVLDVVMRHRLRLCYVSRGQRVPEDLEPVDAQRLLSEALSLDDVSPYLGGETAGELAPQAQKQQARQQALSRGVLRQGDALATTLGALRQYNLGMALLEQAWHRARRPSSGPADFARLMAGATQQSLLASAGMPHALYWSKSASVSGADRAMPLVSLDHLGMPQPLTWPRHRLPVDPVERWQWAERLGAGWHLLMQLPDIAELERFDGAGRGWLAAVTGARRVRHAGEWLTLAQATALGETVGTQTVRHQGRAASLSLTRLEASLSQRRQDVDGLAVVAWYGEIRDRDDGRRLARRYWLSSSQPGLDIASRLAQAVAAETLPALTRQADHLIKARELVADSEQRWHLASMLAALALRLGAEDAGWAMDVRASLSGIAQRRCARRPRALLEALLDMLSAHDALTLAGQAAADRTIAA